MNKCARCRTADTPDIYCGRCTEIVADEARRGFVTVPRSAVTEYVEVPRWMLEEAR